MSLLRLPDVPVHERNSFKQRILKKYEAYQARRSAGKTNGIQEKGERYEIAVALQLYRTHLVNRSEHLSRWTFPAETGTQSIFMGPRNEYDFLVPDSFGLHLGDAKSDSSGLGGDLKKAISFCLLDYFVQHRAAGISGFCFATPTDPVAMFRSALRNCWEILTGISECAGVTGMNTELIPRAVRTHFRYEYTAGGQVVRTDVLPHGPQHYLSELRDHAGFTFRFLRVAPMDGSELERQMEMLESKARWVMP